MNKLIALLNASCAAPKDEKGERIGQYAAESLGEIGDSQAVQPLIQALETPLVAGQAIEALAKLRDHNWPGNVRELRNVIERAVALSMGSVLDADDLWLSSLEMTGSGTAPEAAYSPLSLADLEKEHILRTLNHTDWNKSQAAAILGIERSTLDRKIKVYELQK